MCLNIRSLLSKSFLPKLESRIILKKILNCSDVELITNDKIYISRNDIKKFYNLENKRLLGYPISQLIGSKEFFSLNFKITKDVFIPRPETELLVEIVLEELKKYKNCVRILDLGTGSGAISIAIAKNSKNVSILATDISYKALEIANYNAKKILKFSVDLSFIQSNWYNKINNSRLFNIIISNPPYISFNDSCLNRNNLKFEPLNSLTDYNNGLSYINTILKYSHKYLLKNGSLWIEHGYNQAISVRNMFLKYGFSKIKSINDLSNIERISCGVLI